MFRSAIFLLAILALFSSCEKNITVKLDATSTDLVVDGSIENGAFPIIMLSSSLSYFSKISADILAKSFIHNAVVTLSDGTLTGQLKEDSVANSSSGYEIYYYSFNSSDTGVQFEGKLNAAYSLQIKVNNQVYTATTTIPGLNKKIDSLWWIPAPPGNDSSDVILEARITDPPGYGNYTRYFTSVDGAAFYPGLNSVSDDQITDGTTYDVAVDRGVNRNTTISLSDYAFFSKGDTVTVKYSNIDKATYDFWETMEYNYQSIGNPFSTPTKVLGNISNNALGYFGGYASQYITLRIPH
jgi:hypothetical protein